MFKKILTNFLTDHQERLYIYLLIVGSFGVFFSIIIVATRLMLQRRHSVITDTHMNSPNKANETSGELAEDTTVPSGLNEIDEIDTDIDLTTSVPLPIVSKNEVSCVLFT